MPTLYQIKPQFQQLLRPCVIRLAAQNITPNQVTWATLILSIATGLTLAWSADLTLIWLTLPLILLVRMGLNAIDGMLARDHDQITASGRILNELGDVLSDVALYLPLVQLPGVQFPAVITFLFLTMLTEMTGILGWSIDRQRHYEGPMGKSDRALIVGIIGLIYGLGQHPERGVTPFWTVVWVMVLGLQVVTIVNRIRAMLREVDHAEL